MKFEEFKNQVQNAYGKYFPHSLCEVYVFKCLGKSLDVVCRLVENENEASHHIIGNDMFRISFNIDLPDDFNADTDELMENLVMNVQSKEYVIKPENRYMYCSSRKMSYRKTKGNAEKLVKTLDKYFKELRTAVQEDLENGNIHENHYTMLIKKLEK